MNVSTPLDFLCVETTGRREQIIRSIYANCDVVDMGYDDPNCPECYLWKGANSGKNHRGADYPKMSLDGQTVRVHRVVFVNFEGYLHSKRQVDHKCHQRMCVRYEHLRKATQKQNCLERDIRNGVVRRPKRRKIKRVGKSSKVRTPRPQQERAMVLRPSGGLQ